ncbi:MAG: phytoene desaturase family protein [Bdellovibrionota bacterium]
MKTNYDAIIVGGGHNGLVTASYLAKAGLSVAIFEKRPVVGGCAVTEEPFPGFKFSTLSYVNSLFHPAIIEELKLKDYGFEMLPRNPSSFTPFPNRTHLLLGPDKEMNHREISKFSKKDAENYPKYEAMLEEMAEILKPMMLMAPPNPGKITLGDLTKYGSFLFKKRKNLKKEWPELMRMLAGSATDMLSQWFESEELKVTLATDAVIGANAGPSTPGTAYVLLHHVMGECNGAKGVWGYMRGGMGGLTQSIAKAAMELGVDIYTGYGVDKILIENGKAVGIRTDGQEFRAKIVASNADPNVTFNKLIAENELPAEFLKNVRRINYDSASVKINLALSELPDFLAAPGKTIGPQHMGTIHIGPTLQYVEEAYSDSVAGRPSANPILECSIPTSIDDTLAPLGKHVMNMFVQYGPNTLKNGQNWDQIKESFADRCIDVLAEYAPNIKGAILHRQVLSPLDMEREYSITCGSLHHGRLNLDQMFHMRPVPGWSNYKTPIQGLYICGAGAHPGGGVMGIPGLNAAKAILKDI